MVLELVESELPASCDVMWAGDRAEICQRVVLYQNGAHHIVHFPEKKKKIISETISRLNNQM